MADKSEGKPDDGAPAEPKLPVVWSPKLDAEAAASEDLRHADAGEASSFFCRHGGSRRSRGAKLPAGGRRFATSIATLRDACRLDRRRGGAGLVCRIVCRAQHCPIVVRRSGRHHLGREWPASCKSRTRRTCCAQSEPRRCRAQCGQPIRQACGSARSHRACADRAELEAGPHRRRGRSAGEEKRAGVGGRLCGAETTGSIASPASPAEAKLPDNVLSDWVVQDVRGGRALVQNRYGGMFEVAAGSVLPGLGRIEAVKRQDGQWVVVTAHGVIIER